MKAIKEDYRAWVALGEGGFDHGIPGWLSTNALRVVASRHVLRTDGFELDEQARLADLPEREAARPKVGPHPIPHREIGEDCSPEMLARLDAIISDAHSRYSEFSEIETSKYERHADAIFVQRAKDRGDSRNGEIAHVHHPQGSLHVHCAPADARFVIERGWGELHPLAVRGLGLPRTYILLYAPRTEDDLIGIKQIVDAAVDWASS